jgi:hypothetical protein
LKDSVHRYLIAVVAISALVLGTGLAVAGPAGRPGVVYGVGIAFAFQVVVFWLLAGVLFPTRRMLVYGLGMVGRFLLVALVAVAVVPALAMPAISTLFSLLAVLFLATLLEPAFFHAVSPTGS